MVEIEKHTEKSKVKISQNFVAFSEYMNYTNGIKEYDILFNFRFTLSNLHHLLFWSEKKLPKK